MRSHASILGVSLTNGSEDEPAPKQKNPNIQLKTGGDGYPMLPRLDEIDGHGLPYKKQLIGKFMGDVYSS